MVGAFRLDLNIISLQSIDAFHGNVTANRLYGSLCFIICQIVAICVKQITGLPLQLARRGGHPAGRGN